jgi:hypothetical protein
LKKLFLRGLLRKYTKTTRETNPTIVPPNTSPMKCFPKYSLEKAINTITKGVNILSIRVLKTVAIPPHSAVVLDICPEGKPKESGLNTSCRRNDVRICLSGRAKMLFILFPVKGDIFFIPSSRFMTLLSTKYGLGNPTNIFRVSVNRVVHRNS